MKQLILFLVLLVVAGCKQLPELPAVISPYQIDIQQGNVVTQEMVAKLKPGMTRAQVRFVLGSPMIVDPFRTDRWDYVYMLQKQGKPVERRNITALFDNDKLVRIEGDVVALQPEPKPVAPAGEKLPGKPTATKSEGTASPDAGESAKPAAESPPTEDKPAPDKLGL